MIGKPEWFTYRKFGWGIAPKTKEGFIYVGIFLLLFIKVVILRFYFNLPDNIMITLIGILIGIVILDTLHIHSQLTKVHDERENMHQLVIERNVSFAAITALIIVALYQSINYSIQATNGIVPSSYLPFDWEIGFVLAVMVITKGVSSYYMKNKM